MAYDRRTEGRIVDRFRFRVGKKEYNIPVRLIKEGQHKEHRNDPPPETTKVEFSLAIPDGKEFRGTDIEVLRAAVKAELGEKDAIVWEDYYLIVVEEQRERFYHSCDGGDGMEFYWKTIKVGKTSEGRTVHRVDRWDGTDDIRDGLPETGKKRGKVISLVKAARKAKLALKEFEYRMETLRHNMEKFLSPKNVEKSLCQALTVKQLLGPFKKRRRKKDG